MINVIIPAYNCSKTLERTLGSLAAQTDDRFFVTIVDDCSNEYETELMNEIIDAYKGALEIRYIRNEKNMGCGMSRQVGIDNTGCKYFCFLDSDDAFMPYTIETFNECIKDHPDIEMIHSYFLEETTDSEGHKGLLTHEDGFTWCHGKLYNKDLVTKYGIRNSPEVRWADDSYFNSMCSELMKVVMLDIPMYLWCNNPDSVMRCENPERDKDKDYDFINAMCMSAEFVSKYKDDISFIPGTLKRLEGREHGIREQALIDTLKTYIKEDKNNG